jgi:hypothetical protein
MNICPDCGEVVEEHAYHPPCCPHDHVETIDDRDDRGGAIFHACGECGAIVIPTEPDEDGHTDWEVAF